MFPPWAVVMDAAIARPRPVPPRAGPGLVGAVEALENVGVLLGGHARPLVGDGELDGSGGLRHLSGLPQEIKQLITGMLAYHPASRCTLTDVTTELKKILNDLEVE
jgi:hypothetical protein